jgi:hypothetical protein
LRASASCRPALGRYTRKRDSATGDASLPGLPVYGVEGCRAGRVRRVLGTSADARLVGVLDPVPWYGV